MNRFEVLMYFMATPRPPATVDVKLNEVGDKVDIWWSEVRG